jgi:hypothetical protein
MSEKQKNFKEVKVNYWNFENEGDQIEGDLIRFEEGKYGQQAVLKCPSGEEFVLPSLKVLETKFNQIEVGAYVRVTYQGEIKSKETGNTYKDFVLEVAEYNR